MSADGTRVPFDNGGVYVRDLVANAPLTVSADPTATFSSINGGGTFAGFLLGTGPQIGQLTAGNDVAAPALTFANGRVTVGGDPSGVAQVLVGGAPVRLDAERRRGRRGVDGRRGLGRLRQSRHRDVAGRPDAASAAAARQRRPEGDRR